MIPYAVFVVLSVLPSVGILMVGHWWSERTVGDEARCRLTCWAVWCTVPISKQPGTAGPGHHLARRTSSKPTTIFMDQSQSTGKHQPSGTLPMMSCDDVRTRQGTGRHPAAEMTVLRRPGCG